MSSTESRSDAANGIPDGERVDMKLEVVVLPVSDVERAKLCRAEQNQATGAVEI